MPIIALQYAVAPRLVKISIPPFPFTNLVGEERPGPCFGRRLVLRRPYEASYLTGMGDGGPSRTGRRSLSGRGVPKFRWVRCRVLDWQ